MGRFLEKLARGERAKLRMLRDQLEKAKRAPELRGVGKTVYIWNITQAIDALENRMDKDKDKKEKRKQERAEKKDRVPTPETYPL